MKIIVDAMGGDNAPLEIVKGAVTAAEELGVQIILAGPTEEILRALEEMGRKELPENVEIANAGQAIKTEEDPTQAVRSKKDSSLVIGLNLLRDGTGDAFVSAGSTGALLSGATLIVKRIRGIRRAALAPALPTMNGRTLLIDCGANTECYPEYLLQFAYMGSFYVKCMFGISSPRVALLNNGTEKTKGTPLQKETYSLLERAHQEGKINFIGNLEAREIMEGDCDLVVADGFSGNIFLKAVEGTALFVTSEVKKLFGGSIRSMIAGLLMKKSFKGFKKKMDYSEVGGTAMLGISKPVIKAHGSSNARAIHSSIRQAKEFVESGIIKEIEANIRYMKLEGDT